MSSILDLINPQQSAPPPEERSALGDLAQGARSGGLRAMGAVNTLLGYGKASRGADPTARFAAADDYLQRADQASQGLTSWEDADMGRKGVRWLAGALGQSAPVMLPALAAGAASRNPLVAGAFATAATAPVEVGEQLLRQQQDPANAGKTSAERLDVAGPTGVLAAGAQSIPFLGTGSKLAGRTLTGGNVARNGIISTVGKEAVTGGVTEAGAEGIRQMGDQELNPNAQFDGKAMWDAGLQGAVMSGAVGAAGAPVHAFHKAAAAPGDLMRSGGIALDGAGEKLKGFVGSARTAAEGLDLGAAAQSPKTGGESLVGRAKATAEGIDLTPVTDAASSATERVVAGLGKLREGGSRMASRIASGEQFLNPASFTGKTEESLRAAVTDDGVLRNNAVTKWAQELPEKYLTPEVRAAMTDLADTANQRVVATARAAWQKAQDTAQRVNALAQRSKTKDATDANTKPSLDYRDVDAKVMSRVTPLLQQVAPEMLENQGAAKLAAPLRNAAMSMIQGRAMSSGDVAALIDALGEHTVSVLGRVREGLGQLNDEQLNKFADGLDLLQKAQDDRGLVTEAVKAYAPDAHPDELKAVVDGLAAWATESDGVSPAMRRVRDTEMRAELQKEFGPQGANAILTALDRLVTPKENMLNSEADEATVAEMSNEVSTRRIRESDKMAEGDAAAPEVRTRFDDIAPVERPRTRILDRKLVANEEASPAKEGYQSAQKQAEQRAQKLAGEDREVRWVPARELGDDNRLVRAARMKFEEEGTLQYGFEGKKLSNFVNSKLLKMGAFETDMPAGFMGLTDNDVAGMRMDRGRDKSPSAVKVFDDEGKTIAVLDAVKVLEKMAALRKGKDAYNSRDDAGGRDFRMMAEGISELSDYFGEPINLPNSTVINKQGLTWGEAQKTGVDQSAEADSKRDLIMEQAIPEMTASELRTEATRVAELIDTRTSQEADVRIAELKEAGARLSSELVRDVYAEVRQDLAAELQPHRELLGKLQGAQQKFMSAPAAAGGLIETGPFGPTFQDGKTLDQITPTGISPETGRAPSLLGPNSALARTKEQPAAPEAEPKGLDAQLGWLDRQSADQKRFIKQLEGRSEQQLEAMRDALENVPLDGSAFQGPDGEAQRQRALSLVERALDRFDQKAWEDSPDPKAVAAKKAAFLEKARSGDKALLETLKASDDAKGLQRAAEALFDEPDAREALDTINDRLRELIVDPDVAYGMLGRKYSMLVSPQIGPRQSTFADAEAYIKKVLGPKVEVTVENIPHAGDFTPGWARGKAEDLIRLSMHHLNPMSAAFHESMHGFIEHLTRNKLGEATNVLIKAASSPTVMLRLREQLKGSPDALKQLDNMEERVAYMYQFHASGVDLGLGAPAKGVFAKIAEFIRSALGIWSTDQRALHIMEYFQQGNLPKAKGAGDIRAALMEPGTNKKLEWFKKAGEPLANLGEAVAVAGHQRLRDTEIPALVELADKVKLKTTSEGGDPGFIPAAREERGIRMNAYADQLADVNAEGMSAALDVLQGADRAATLGTLSGEAKIAAATAIQATRNLLRGMKTYLDKAGVEMGDLGPDYFPRVYDLNYISSHKAEFLTALKNHGVQNADGILQKLMTVQGAEFEIEVSRPGMQASKQRVLADVPDNVLRPFMEKDLLRIVDGYVTQATRRAEWARRFDTVDAKGEAVPNGALNDLLTQARREGATEKDLDAANKYIKAVDGTLGDTISPEFRRLQGNIMVYQNLRTLPLMIFSSIVDPGGILVRGGTVGDAFGALKRGLREIPKNFQSDPKHDSATKLAADLGTIESAVLASVLGEAYTQGMVGETGRKINDTLFKYNLANQFNTSMRVAATEAAVKFLARHGDGTGQHSSRYLSELGLQPSDLVFDTNPQGVKSLRVTQADGLTPEQALKMRQAINRWVDGAVLRPDAADKPIWMSDPHYALIAHLKQFTFAFQETILKRAAHEVRNGNYTPVYALASYIPMMIAADTLKAALTGAQGPGEELDDLLMRGTERAGLLGVGQFPVDMLQDVGRGGSGISPLLGPTLEQFAQAVQVVGGRRSFGTFVVDSMPANAVYENHLGGGEPEMAPAR